MHHINSERKVRYIDSTEGSISDNNIYTILMALVSAQLINPIELEDLPPAVRYNLQMFIATNLEAISTIRAREGFDLDLVADKNKLNFAKRLFLISLLTIILNTTFISASIMLGDISDRKVVLLYSAITHEVICPSRVDCG